MTKSPKLIETEKADPAEADQKTRNLFILYHASRALSSILEVEELVEMATDICTEVMSVEWGAFYLLGDEMDALELRNAKGADPKLLPQAFKLADGLGEWAKEKPDPIPYRDLRADMPLCRSFPGLKQLADFSPYYVVPTFHKLKFVGLLILGKRVNGQAFSENDLELLNTIVLLAANAILNAHLYELAILDGTTRLFVVRYFRQRLKEEIKRAGRYAQALTLIMLDIDHFKEVNDSHGHLAGDRVLSEIGTIIHKCTREYVDVPCRYGGEEFAILLPETDSEGGFHVAERIRKTIENTAFFKDALTVTVSAGIASYPNDALAEEALIEKADLALYEAKRAGRNNVAAAS